MNNTGILKRNLMLVAGLLTLALLTGCGGAATLEASPTSGSQSRSSADGTPRPTFTPVASPTVVEGTSTPGIGTPSAPTPLQTETGDAAASTPGEAEEASSTPSIETDGTVSSSGDEVAAGELPAIYRFLIRPTEIEVGGRVYLAWDARGESARICPKTYLGWIDRECFDVPLIGSQYITIHADEQTWDYYGYELHVTAHGKEVVAFLPITVTCQGGGQWWFFLSDPYTTHVPEQCPVSAPFESTAAAQRFEQGMMLWVEATGQVLVFFDDGTYQTFGDLTASGTSSPVDETPPPGLFEPVSGFGMLWRGEVPGSEGLRARLGWAVEEEFTINTAYQCYAEAGELMCFVRGPEVEIIRLHPDGHWDIWSTE